MGDDILSRPLTLPCGVILPGRIVKAAMTEGLGDEWNRATKEHVKLYSEWSKGHNAGHVLITGNIAVDRRFPERPGNVAIDGKQSVEALGALRAYANAGKHDGTLIFAQLSHGGRQSNQMVNLNPVAPSAVSTSLAGMIPLGEPRALSLEEIDDVINRFVFAAEVCKEVGFSGIQIHGAHGYLLSSFLNPLANKRDDIFGGSLDNRSRILFEIVRRTRAKVGRNYPIAVKLNSSDFQKGGFEPEESLEIARRLEAEGVDILEISGGNYENPSMMMGPDGLSKVKSLSQMGKYTSTQVREGYFMVFAEKMRQTVKKMPLMVTGGFRSRVMMESALQSGAADLIGVGRPLCGGYDYVGKLLRREIDQLPKFETSIDLPWFLRFLKYIVVGHFIQSGGFQAWTYCNLVRLGKGEKPTTDKDANLLFDLIRMTTHDSGQATRLKGLPDIRGQFLNAPKSSRFKIGVSIALVFVLVLLARRVLKHSL